MPRVYLTSYATERFESVQRDLNASAIQWGVPNILTYREVDLKSSDYYQRNRSILNEVCGAGYWAWKPYFILQALEHLKENDILFYCDAGSMFVASPEPLIQLCANHPQGMILFDARPLTNRQFTKRDCFIRMGCDDPSYWDTRMVIATLLVIRKTEKVVAFLNKWLAFCHDRAAITDDANVCGQENLPGYLQHRWDQSILSVLAAKYNLETFRNPTLWGNFLKLSPFRVAGEQISSPYKLPPEIKTYAPSPQENSPYGTLFIINRQPNYLGKTLINLPPGKSQKSMLKNILSILRSPAR
jgi:hypothetical protein